MASQENRQETTEVVDTSKEISQQNSNEQSLDNTNEKTLATAEANLEAADDTASISSSEGKPQPPWQWKLMAVVLLTLIRFGGAWGTGIISPMKSTLKKQLKIDNTEYALLDASDSFIKTVLILITGYVTDRYGGANILLYGNGIYSVGSVLMAGAAQMKSYKFFVVARIIMSLGDCSTQIAQYQVFSSWFAPSNGFASTLGIELMFNKLGSLAGSGTANVINANIGFAWVYWIAFFVNIFTNFCCYAFFWFTKRSEGKYGDVLDPATGGRLKKRSKKLDYKKVISMPWSFWVIIGYGMFTTITIVIFNSNATEFAEQRFSISAVKAGWYTTLAKDAGFILIPAMGFFSDYFGNRLTLMAITSFGIFTAMLLVNYASTVSGTAAAFGIYAVATTFSPMSVIDAIRVTLADQIDFGTAYAIKVLIANSLDVIVAIVAGVIQDNDNNSYDHVVVLYLALSACSVIMCVNMLVFGYLTIDVGMLQWTRKQRMVRGDKILERNRRTHEEDAPKNRRLSTVLFSIVLVLMVGSWAAYIWGAATGNNYDA